MSLKVSTASFKLEFESGILFYVSLPWFGSMQWTHHDGWQRG